MTEEKYAELSLWRFLKSNIGSTVHLDLVSPYGCFHESYEEDTGKRLNVTFPISRVDLLSATIAEAARNRRENVIGIIAPSIIHLNSDELSRLSMRWEGSSIHVYISYSTGSPGNPYSYANYGDEAHEYFVYGAYFIARDSSEGGEEITLTEAPMTSELRKQVDCARKSWGVFRKFLQCPLL